MKLIETVGATSRIWQIFVADASSTTGAGLPGLVFNSSGLTAYYHRDTDTTATAITLVTMTVGTFTSSGFKEIDSTNMPGWYQLCPPNAALASGAKSVALHLKGATNMAPLPIEVELTAFDLQTATQSVNVSTINSVSTSSVTTVSANQGTTQPLNFTGTAGSALVKGDMVDIAGAAVSTSSAQLGVNAVNIGGTAQTGRDIGASVLLSAGTGTGQLDFTSGVVKANLAQILGTALTETAGQIAAAFKKFFNIATPASTMDHLTLLDTVTTATTATNLTNAPTAGDFTAAMKTSLNAATPVATVSGDFSATMKTSLNAATPVATVSGDFSATMKTSLNAATPVASLSGDFTTTMKTSIGTAVAASAVASVTAPVTLTTAYDAAKTAAQAGDVMKVSSGTGANQLSLSSGVVAADIKKINGTTVLGDGATTPWGP